MEDASVGSLALQLWGPHENVPASLRALSQIHRICSYGCVAFPGKCTFPLLSTTVPASGSQPFPAPGKGTSGRAHVSPPGFVCSTGGLDMRRLDGEAPWSGEALLQSLEIQRPQRISAGEPLRQCVWGRTEGLLRLATWL